MEPEITIENVKQLISLWTVVAQTPEQNRLDVVVRAVDLLNAVKALTEARWGYLSAVTGLDVPGAEQPSSAEKQWTRLDGVPEQSGTVPMGIFEVLYHFCRGPVVLTLRVRLPHAHAVLPSICSLQPTATLFERELIEMFGVEVTGTPNTDHLLLPDDWPSGVYPLRKEFHGLDSASRPDSQEGPKS